MTRTWQQERADVVAREIRKLIEDAERRVYEFFKAYEARPKRRKR